MAIDRHVGRDRATFSVEGNPDKYIGLIARHGTLCRVMCSRKCPCATITGSPNMYCNLCFGDGFVYNFQRKFLNVDEDCDAGMLDRSLVEPFRIPLLEPVKVERMLPPEQGGIKQYEITDFNTGEIFIKGDPLPNHWEKMRVTYFFDRFTFVRNEIPNVNTNTKTLTTVGTFFDDENKTSNFANVHGDITKVLSIKRISDGFKFNNFQFRKNQIMLNNSEPAPQQNDIIIDYFYVEPTRVLPANLESSEEKEKWMMNLSSATLRMGLEPWYELAAGDLITIMVSQFWRDEVIKHGDTGVDKLTEFDIGQIDDEILDEKGNKYFVNDDFILRPFRDLVWVGNQPDVGKRISVRYGYHPTYKIFRGNPEPNSLENKRYPIIVMTRLWNQTMQRDIETISNPKTNPKLQNFDIGSLL